MKPKLVPHLWFQTDAREVANFYLKVFGNSSLIRTVSFPEPNGTICYLVTILLYGQELILMNASSDLRLNDSFSMVISCHTQEEIDYYWDKLCADGGRELTCGWLKDKYGMFWQIVPDFMDDMMSDNNIERLLRVYKVAFKSVKFNITELQKAYQGID